MIEFERINEKGDRVKAYTHKSYLSSHYDQEVSKIESRNQTWTNVTFYGTGIISYWVIFLITQALHKFSVLNEFVQNKISYKGKFLIASATAGLITSLFVAVGLTGSLRNTREALLKKEIFPAWLNKEKVVNPQRVFFELDDNNNNEPTIWHSSMYYFL